MGQPPTIQQEIPTDFDHQVVPFPTRRDPSVPVARDLAITTNHPPTTLGTARGATDGAASSTELDLS